MSEDKLSELDEVRKNLENLSDGDEITVETESSIYKGIKLEDEHSVTGDDGAEVSTYYFKNGEDSRIEVLVSPENETDVVMMETRKDGKKEKVRSIKL